MELPGAPGAPGAPRARRPPARLRRAAVGLAALVGFALLLEGLASLALALSAFLAERPAAERLHTEHDPELGWIHRPGLHLPDFYGPGRSLTTTSRRFRGKEELPRDVPAGKVRALCAGDSFTLGYGVDDDDAWVAALSRLEPRLETVNLGQGGYGIDQAVLWYRRAAELLEHDVFVLAFISFDFLRMQTSLSKGILTFEQGRPLRRHPPPERALLPWIRRELDPDLFASVRLLRKLLGGETEGERGDPARRIDTDETLGRALDLIRSVHRPLRARGGELVLVHLPMVSDLAGDGSADLRRLLAEASRREGWHHVDLVAAFRDLPRPRAAELYIRPGEVDFPGAEGHLNEAGNALVAELLLARLAATPLLAQGGEEPR